MPESETEVNNAQAAEGLADREPLVFGPKMLDLVLPAGYVLDPESYKHSVVNPNTPIEPDMFIQTSYGTQVDSAEDGSLRLLYDDIKKFPLLTKRLEKVIFTHRGLGHTIADLKSDPDFWEAFDHEDPEKVKILMSSSASIDELVMNANFRLVAMVASRFRGRIPMSDMIAEGSVGMQRAVEKFDIEKGFKFSTYATHWIRQGITRAISDQQRTIRMPVHAVEDYTKLDRIVEEFFLEYGKPPKFHELVELGRLNNIERTRVESIVEVIMSGSARHITSLDAPLVEEGEGTLGDFVEDEKDTEEAFDLASSKIDREQLLDAMSILDVRERKVVLLRFGFLGKEHTLEEVGREFDVTRERIRQIELKALRKLRESRRVQGIRSRDSRVAQVYIEPTDVVYKDVNQDIPQAHAIQLEPSRQVRVYDNQETTTTKVSSYEEVIDFYDNSEFVDFDE